VFSEAVPEPLAAWLGSVFEMGRHVGATPSVGDFLEQFEKLMSTPVPEPRDLSSFATTSAVPLEEMESAGSVSDFAEDWTEEEPKPAAQASYKPSRSTLKPVSLRSATTSFTQTRRNSSGSLGMALWAFGTVAVLLLAWFTLFRSAAADSGVIADMPAPASLNSSAPAPIAGERSPAVGATPQPRGPEIIKKAIVPPQWEVEQLRSRENASSSSPGVNESMSQGMVDATAPK